MNIIMFKDYLKKDLNIFINQNEFAEEHNIDGQDISIVVDNDKLKEIKIKSLDGTYAGDVLFYIKKSNLEEKPAIGQRMEFDYELYSVSSIEEDNEIYTITLEAYMS